MSDLLLERRGPHLLATLNRPERRNAIDTGLRDQLDGLLDLVEADDVIEAVAFVGAGVCFSSGADLSEFGTAPPPLEARDVRLARDVWGRLATARPILAAVVHGACIGAGLELALLCDLRIAREDAWFALPEAQLGLIPAAGGTQTLPRAVAGSRAVHMLLTSDRLGAEAAYAAGLVSQVAPVTVEPGDLAWQVLARLGDNAPARRRRLRDHWRRGGS